jgi:hypothetical protein
MPIDDRFDAEVSSDDAEERSKLVPFKSETALSLAAAFSVIATASTGIEAVTLASAASFFAIASGIVAACAERRQKELVRRLHSEFQSRSVSKQQLEGKLNAANVATQELIAEAVVRASEAKSSERVKRIARLLVTIVLSDEQIAVEEARVMLEMAGELFDLDAFVLGRMAEVQGPGVVARKGHPELNDVRETWQRLRELHSAFREGSINPACARLQAYGLVMKIEPPTGAFDLQTYPYSITEFGVRFYNWCLQGIN